MKSVLRIYISVAAILGAVLCGFPASADELKKGFDDLDSDNPFAADPVTEDDLDSSRGLNLITENDSVNLTNSTGVSAGNSATNNVSGHNSIDDSALNNNAGIVTVFQNSGNNNILQQSTILNVNLSN